MISNTELRNKVRRRSGFRCEFCGISETDSGGELTIDHFRPKSKGGDDSSENLIYSCIRCNQYKLDYWPETSEEPMLFNPRIEKFRDHFLKLDDGTLYPLTPTGTFTLKRLRLNRPPLVANRLRKIRKIEDDRLLKKYESLAHLLDQMLSQQTELMEEQQKLLREQYELLDLLLKR